ncbi:amino acid ABC transporter permease [Secundilactobacillus similis DSM 23365 = JCM 2765]|jgi:polar amino acid transport system permease protein|uniref:ABC superfamily ATP binding cassette transporter, membrane protein n=1 Tax=Secundilactobacillus similis DSM 23365 = JCM 2765 TaxID=1423804 RepID=A0A0R2EMH1_9LACO|nr:ABC superfamily ATP binding cassette transporter, membrane protein [Secundilactobacillus similis DSM 23365 = JCM 2765]
MGISWQVIQQSLPVFEKGLVLTLWLSLIGIIGAIIVGLVCSLLQYFKVPVLHQIVSVYVEVSRNTPLLVQLFFLYYAFPVFGFKMNAEMCGIVGLIFLGGSYMAEGFTGGFNGVSKTQVETGKAIGLTRGQLARYVVFPQGFALSVPALAANIIFLIKETSIFTVIAIPELTNTALDLIGMYYRSNEYLLVLVVGYAIILIPLSILLTILEKRVRYGAFGN